MTEHEIRAFVNEVRSIAATHSQTVAFVNNLALTLLRDGLSEPDIWDEVNKCCAVNRRNQNG